MASLNFKWRTLKGWEDVDGKALELLKEYYKEGVPMSCMQDRPNEDRRKILCELIDAFDGDIDNDWTGEVMTKDEAKKYVMEYGK